MNKSKVIKSSVDNDRVYSYSFDYIITKGDTVDDVENRILNEIQLIDGIEVVGNPGINNTSWSKEEYGIASSMQGQERGIQAIMDEYGCSREEAIDIMNSEVTSGCHGKDKKKNKKEIKSSPNFKKYTADDLFDTFDVSLLTSTVFMDRERCKEAKCGMVELMDLMWEVAPTWLGIRTPDDIREVCRRAKNPQAKAFLEAFETAMENAKFTDKFYDSVEVHKKRNVQSSCQIESSLLNEFEDSYCNASNDWPEEERNTYEDSFINDFAKDHGITYDETKKMLDELQDKWYKDADNAGIVDIYSSTRRNIINVNRIFG